jgi:hypothetical protein
MIIEDVAQLLHLPLPWRTMVSRIAIQSGHNPPQPSFAQMKGLCNYCRGPLDRFCYFLNPHFS